MVTIVYLLSTEFLIFQKFKGVSKMSYQGKNLNGIFKERYRKDQFLKETIECINCETGKMKSKIDGSFADNDIKQYICYKCGTKLYEPTSITEMIKRNRNGQNIK